MLYRLIRHVIIDRDRQPKEVWGIDRPAANLPTVPSPKSTDKDDPLRQEPCSPLLTFQDGRFVTWDSIFEWFSEAESAGYTVLTGFKKLSPYTQIVIRGP